MKKITDRLIERARLGELPDAQYRELVAELQRRGEMHRLEAAIARDEEFLNEYPPRMMAARIRSKLVEDEVKAPSDNPFNFRHRAPVLAFAALLAVAVVLVVYMSADERPQAMDSARADATRPAVNVKQGGGMKPSTSQKPEPKWRGENVHQDLVCVKGERYSFASDPIDKMSVMPLGPVKALAKDGGQTLVIECHDVGSAMIEIPRQTKRDGRTVNFYEKIHVDVARTLDETETAAIEERMAQLDECKTEQEPPVWFRRAKLTIHWNPDGKVRNVGTKGSSALGPVLDCLTKVVEGWQLPDVSKKVVLREHKLDWENIRGPEAFVDEHDAGQLGRPGRENSVTKAQSALLRGDDEQAIRHCESFLATNPTTGAGRCHRILGVAYKNLGNLEKACPHLELGGVTNPACDGATGESKPEPKSGEKKKIDIW